MKRIAFVITAALALAAAATASGAPAPVFSVVGDRPAALPSAQVPNADGALVLPPAFTEPPLTTQTLSFAELNALWHQAGAAYGIPWQVLAAINKIESNFGRNMGPSSAGAVGWMQFMPATWLRWGMDGSGDGVADPWNPQDGVFAAARYLAAAGGQTDLERAVFAYNHADWYVQDVLELAAVYGNGGGALTFTLDRLQAGLNEAQQAVTTANEALVDAEQAARAARRAERALLARLNRTPLLSERLELEKRATQTGFRAARAAEVVAERREALDAAQAALDAARAGAAPASLTPQAGLLLGTPSFVSGWAFPVGGGPSVVSVGHDHHDYPAADIAAPMGAPLYALTDGVVEHAWPLGSGRCGIGFLMRAFDGRTWTYCHLSYLEPSVTPGTPLSVGTSVGLLGTTGHSSGPHLHLQTGPELTYPQEEEWFRAFAGTAFSWQGESDTQPVAVAPAFGGPLFSLVETRIFDVVEDEESLDGVIEFSIAA